MDPHWTCSLQVPDFKCMGRARAVRSMRRASTRAALAAAPSEGRCGARARRFAAGGTAEGLHAPRDVDAARNFNIATTTPPFNPLQPFPPPAIRDSDERFSIRAIRDSASPASVHSLQRERRHAERTCWRACDRASPQPRQRSVFFCAPTGRKSLEKGPIQQYYNSFPPLPLPVQRQSDKSQQNARSMPAFLT